MADHVSEMGTFTAGEGPRPATTSFSTSPVSKWRISDLKGGRITVMTTPEGLDLVVRSSATPRPFGSNDMLLVGLTRQEANDLIIALLP